MRGPRLGPVSGGGSRSNLTPIVPAGRAQGVFAGGARGSNSTITPQLPLVTTPGNLLFAVIGLVAFVATTFPASATFTGAAWTVDATQCCDYSGQNIGGPCAIPFTANCAGVCTSGVRLIIAHRFVAAGESTVTPTAVGSNTASTQKLVWLWELPTTTAPINGTTTTAQAAGATTTGAIASIPGNAFGVLGWMTATGHGSVPTPIASGVSSGTMLHHCNTLNDPTVNAAQGFGLDIWFQMVTLAAGGVIGTTIQVNPAYTAVNYGAVGCTLPAGIVLPEIPFPANQVIV